MEKKQMIILGLLSILAPGAIIAILLSLIFILDSSIFSTVVLRVLGPIAGLIIFVGLFLLFGGIFKR